MYKHCSIDIFCLNILYRSFSGELDFDWDEDSHVGFLLFTWQVLPADVERLYF